jgi:hypothetical protein
MRPLGALALVAGVLSLLLAVGVIVGNRDLQIPGPQLDLLGPAFGGWRLALGIELWLGATLLTVAFLALGRMPGLAWLMLLAYLLLLAPYVLLGAVMPTAIAVVVVAVLLGVVVPIVVMAIAAVIGRAVARRRGAVPLSA